MNEETKLAKED